MFLKLNFKKIFFYLFSLLFLICVLEILSYFLVKQIKNNPLIKESEKFYKLAKTQTELLAYTNLIPYVNADELTNFILNKINKMDERNFYVVYEKFNDKNKENILIQGDSWAEIANSDFIKNDLVELAKKNSLGLINSGITSYSISPMKVQFQILTKKFNLRPSIVIAIIDQTDIGDEIHRYQSMSLRNLSLQDTQINEEFKERFINTLNGKSFNLTKIILCFKKFYYSKYLQFNSNHILALRYVFKRIYYLFTGTPTVLAPLIYGLSDEENKVLNSRFNNYINEVFKQDVKKLVFVTHPHKNHLTKKKQYTFEVGDFLESIIENSTHKDKIQHINFNKNFFKIYKNLEFEEIWAKNDESSHLSEEVYKKFYFPNILNNICCN